MEFYPTETTKKMIEIAENNKDIWLADKFKWILSFPDEDNDKKNRLFGYYQHVGEDFGYWILNQVRDWVRDEKNQ